MYSPNSNLNIYQLENIDYRLNSVTDIIYPVITKQLIDTYQKIHQLNKSTIEKRDVIYIIRI